MKIPQVHLIQNEKKLIKPEWVNFAENDSRRIFKRCSIKNDVFGELAVGIRNYEDGFNRWIIEVKNSLNKVLGKEILSVDQNSKAMIGYDIFVQPEYRKKHGFGELMRLFGIMEMMENKSPFLKIYSKDTAVYFHSKYKFKPSNTSFEERNKMLESMSQDCSKKFEDLAKKAKALKEKATSTKNLPAVQRELCVETNNLATEYIARALKEGNPQIEHSFNYGMDMILTKESIEKNSDFFNKLFNKHGIDYKI